ncbi:hypothetical protein GCM10010275_67120 [Streptomyces litmocidini]|nr:hypothetical protein GCM10010275_67120 [Streptomyces litmocidini]
MKPGSGLEADAHDVLADVAGAGELIRITTPVPAHLTDCPRTLRMLCASADRGVRPSAEPTPDALHRREAVRDRLAELLDLIVKR